jgi:hypothetical protein
MFRSLRNDAIYRFSRVQRDEQGQAEHSNSHRGSAATRRTAHDLWWFARRLWVTDQAACHPQIVNLWKDEENKK